MAKNWTVIRSDRGTALPKAEEVKKLNKARKAIANVPMKSIGDLIKEGAEAHTKAVAREEALVAAADNGLLKSETLKQEAVAITKKKAKAQTKEK